jgi:gliding motility-associated lipoprotein GldD
LQGGCFSKAVQLSALDYPIAKYADFENECVYLRNEFRSCYKRRKGLWVYNVSKMKATIYLTYKPVNNNINVLLRDAQKLTYEHVIKADDILEQPYLNPAKKVYGMFYQVDGNAATNLQFYATDSTKHFVTGSVYFMQSPIFLLCLRPVILK